MTERVATGRRSTKSCPWLCAHAPRFGRPVRIPIFTSTEVSLRAESPVRSRGRGESRRRASLRMAPGRDALNAHPRGGAGRGPTRV
jgi:hypothetical protein